MKTKVVHSLSKDAWNVIGMDVGCKFKVARCPYVLFDGIMYEKLNNKNKQEALEHAKFISECFNKKNDN